MKSIKGRRNIDAYNIMAELDGLSSVCEGLSLLFTSRDEKLTDAESSRALRSIGTWIERISEDMEMLDEGDTVGEDPVYRTEAG